MSTSRIRTSTATSLAIITLASLLLGGVAAAQAATVISGSASGPLAPSALIPIASGVPNDATPYGLAISPDGQQLFATNNASNTLSVITTATNTELLPKVTLGGGAPMGIASSPDGAWVYIAQFGAGKVAKVSTASHAVTLFSTSSVQPASVAVSPNGSRLYVTLANGSVDVLDAGTGAIVTTIASVGAYPYAVMLNPSGTRAYVTSVGDNVVVVIDTATNTVVTTITGVGTYPIAEAVSPDGSRLYVAGQQDNIVRVIDTATNALLATTYAVGAHPDGVALSPDGGTLYVPARDSNNLSVIDLASGVISTLATGSGPEDVAVSPDGTRVYVANMASHDISVFAATRLLFSGAGSVTVGASDTTFDVSLTDGNPPAGAFMAGTVTVELLDSTATVVASSTGPNHPALDGTVSVTVPTAALGTGSYSARVTFALGTPPIVATASGFTVGSAPADPAPALAATGANPTLPVLLALSLLLVGACMLVLVRLRRSRG